MKPTVNPDICYDHGTAFVTMTKNFCLGCSVYAKEVLLRLQCLW